MRRSLRVTAGVLVASTGLLAATLAAGAAVTPHTTFPDAIGKNDLKIRTSPSSQLNMGGSSFDAPLAIAATTQWNSITGKAPIATYNTTKSGTGRADMLSGTYNIGFSDFPMNQGGDSDVGAGAAAGSSPSNVVPANTPYTSLNTGDFVQVPVVLGGTAVIFHFGTGVSGSEATLIRDKGLTLSGPVTGEIFAGKIKNWDSPAIGNLNKDLYIKGKDALPNLPIVVLSRTSGSGTTYDFKDYLSEVDPKDFPTSTNPNSTQFSAAASTYANSGLLTQGVDSTNGAIGYVEYGYAVQNGVPTANTINASGKVVKLSEKGILEAATVGLQAIVKNKACKGFNTAKLACYAINNEKGATVWPIALFSYGMIYKNQTNLTNTICEVKFLDYLVHSAGGKSKATTFGQDLADENGYVPLPATMQTVARNLLLQVKVNGKVVLNSTD